jgi:hypothetical protein
LSATTLCVIADPHGERPAPANAGQTSFDSEKAMPQHPGRFIRAEIIEGRGLFVSHAADALRVLRPTEYGGQPGAVCLRHGPAGRIAHALRVSPNAGRLSP